jgi:hypothetical protein
MFVFDLQNVFPEMKLWVLVISKENYNVLSPNFHICCSQLVRLILGIYEYKALTDT